MMHPFEYLQNIEQQSRFNASALPQQVESVATWRGIGFMLAGQSYVANMAEVVEILQPPRVTRVPGVKNWVMGIANVRGRMVSVMDLAGLLNLPVKTGWRSQRVLVIEQNDHLVGLLVDAVLGMQTFPVDREAPVTDLPESLVRFVERGFGRDGRVWPVLQLSEITQSPEFLHIAV